MFRIIAGLIVLPVVIAADLLSSKKESSGDGDGYSGNYPDSDDSGYSGRWTQNEMNIRDNIDAGMAIKEDE